jgi:hypothetical protein
MHLLLALSLLGTTGCFKKTPPCWLDNKCSSEKGRWEYTHQKWMTGVGSSDDNMKEAEEAAVRGIAERFSVIVEQDALKPQQEQEITAGATSTAYSQQSLSIDVRAETKTELSGVRIVERYQKDGGFYALAALERGPILKQIDIDLSELDDQIGQVIFAAEQEGSKVEAVRDYGQALYLIRQSEVLNRKRAVVDFAKNRRAMLISVEDIFQRQESLFRDMKISSHSDAGSIELQKSIAESFAGSHFRMLDIDGELQLDMRSTESIIPPDDFGYHKIRIKIDMSIAEPLQDNRILLQQQLIGEGASENLYQAHSLAIKKLKSQVTGRSDIGLQLRQAILGEEG